jgi:hypothetical protein
MVSIAKYFVPQCREKPSCQEINRYTEEGFLNDPESDKA